MAAMARQHQEALNSPSAEEEFVDEDNPFAPFQPRQRRPAVDDLLRCPPTTITARPDAVPPPEGSSSRARCFSCGETGPEEEHLEGDCGPLLVVRRSCLAPRSSDDDWLRNNMFQSTCTIGGKYVGSSSILEVVRTLFQRKRFENCSLQLRLIRGHTSLDGWTNRMT
ncbi:hypothetical protein LWI29_010007 [Acer saccharum]|uniref:Uncharacterized protein n=1 Tax=Acer saccharum TaxID=4024 RepID=A0AA39W869_ACESA|nr:hypothetical protein LWI29_010007 [Acer saccharum]